MCDICTLALGSAYKINISYQFVNKAHIMNASAEVSFLKGNFHFPNQAMNILILKKIVKCEE